MVSKINIFEFKIKYDFYDNNHIKVQLIDMKENYGSVLYELTKDLGLLKGRNEEDQYLNWVDSLTWPFAVDLIKYLEIATLKKNDLFSNGLYYPLFKFNTIKFEYIDYIYRIIVINNKIIDFNCVEMDRNYVLFNKIKYINNKIEENNNYLLSKIKELHSLEREDGLLNKRKINEIECPIIKFRYNNGKYEEYTDDKKIKIDKNQMIEKINKNEFRIVETSKDRRLEIVNF